MYSGPTALPEDSTDTTGSPEASSAQDVAVSCPVWLASHLQPCMQHRVQVTTTGMNTFTRSNLAMPAAWVSTNARCMASRTSAAQSWQQHASIRCPDTGNQPSASSKSAHRNTSTRSLAKSQSTGLEEDTRLFSCTTPQHQPGMEGQLLPSSPPAPSFAVGAASQMPVQLGCTPTAWNHNSKQCARCAPTSTTACCSPANATCQCKPAGSAP